MSRSRLARACANLFLASIASVAAIAAAASPKPSAPAEEMRGMWVVRYSLTSPQAIRNVVRVARNHNFNTLFVQVRGRADAWYRSDLEPRAEGLAGTASSYDPLTLVVEEAHRSGLKVHAWLNTYLTWTGKRPPRSSEHILKAHPDWIARDRDNRFTTVESPTMEGAYVQPSNPAVQEHLFRVFTDVARRYDVDGIHFDFVRYPNAGYDLSDGALARFGEWMLPRMSEDGRAAVRADKGRLAWVHTFPTEWAAWRRLQVTQLVRRVAESVHAAKPWVAVTAAVFADPDDAAGDKGQDWRTWLAEGYLDAVCPMAYSQDTEKVARLIAKAMEAASGKHVYAGIGSWRISSQETAAKIDRVRALGAQGFSLFSYDDVTREGRRMDYLDHLSRSTLASRAAPPEMHWRTPRKGGEGR